MPTYPTRISGLPEPTVGYLGGGQTEIALEEAQTRDETLGNVIAYGAPAAITGFAHTVAESVGLVDDDEFMEFVGQMGEFGDFYRRNRQAAQTVGDLTGMFIPGMVAVKGLQAASRGAKLINGLKNNRLVNGLLLSNKTRDQALRAVRFRDRYLSSTAVASTNLLRDTTRRGLINAARVERVGDVVKANVAFELGVLATMNESSTLYPEEWTMAEILALNSVLPGVAAGVELVQVNRAIRSSAQAAANRSFRALNPEGRPINMAVSRKGSRDIPATIDALTAADLNKVRDELLSSTADVKTRSLGRENYRRARDTYIADMQEQVELMGRDVPIGGITHQYKVSKANMQAVRNGLDKDPTILLGTESLEELPQSVKAINDRMLEREAGIKRMERAYKKAGKDYEKAVKAGNSANQTKFAEEQARLQNDIATARGYEDFVLEANGELMLFQTRKTMFQDQPGWQQSVEFSRATKGDPGSYTVNLPRDPLYDKSAAKVGFTNEGVLLVNPGRGAKTVGGLGYPARSDLPFSDRRVHEFENLSLFQRTGAYAAVQKTVKNFNFATTTPVRISENSHWTELDFVSELAARAEQEGKDLTNALTMPSSWGNIDDIQFAALDGKSVEYMRLRRTLDDSAKSLRLKPQRRYLLHDLSRMLNLPETSDGSIHPIMEVFEELYQEGAKKSLKNTFRNMEQVRREMQEAALSPQLIHNLDKKIATRGDMLRFDTEASPMHMIKRPVDELTYTRDGFAREAETQRLVNLNRMIGAREAGAEFVGEVVEELVEQLPTTIAAQQVGDLIEGGQFGSGLFTTQAKAEGEIAAMTAMRQIEALTDKRFNNKLGALFKGFNHEGRDYSPDLTFAKLRNPNNRGDMESFNLFVNARRSAWDLEEGFVEEGGLFFVKLAKGADNEDRWFRRFGEKMPEDALMPTRGTSPIPLAMTAMAKETAETVDALSAIVRNNSNHIRQIGGWAPLNRKSHYVPPKNFARQETVFVFDDAANRVEQVVPGVTQQQARDLANKIIKESNNPNLSIATQADGAKYFDIMDQAFERMLDMSDSLNQTGRATGKSASPNVTDIGPEVLGDIVETVQRQFQSILRRSRAQYFEPQINLAKKFHQISQPAGAQKGQGVYQRYLATLFGNPTLNPYDVPGRIYYTLESWYDDTLNVLRDKTADFGYKSPIRSRDEALRYQEIEKKLGEFNPFKNATEFAEQNRLRTPPKMKAHMAELNRITSLLTLRLFETGHSILTMTSLGATMPAVIRGLQMTDAEKTAGAQGLKEWQRRVGAFGYTFPDGKKAMFSPARVLTSATHEMFTPEGRKIWKEAAEQGFMEQQVSEIFNTITAPKEGYWENLIGTYGRFATLLSDGSERMARGVSWYTGYHIATRMLGIEKKKHAFAFAHRFANDIIGDYTPTNRPRIFQGAVGMPLGLFMTFMQNYYQRIFGYIENAQTKALVTQYATQASVFGAQTVPGFQQFATIFASNYDGSSNIVDGMENRFGTAATEVFLYGALSNLPKLLGADDGIALYTRGDTSIRSIPTLVNIQDSPSVNFMLNSMEFMSRMVDQVVERGGLSAQQSAELLATYTPSRVMRNAIELATGTSIDRRGQVVNEDTRRALDVIARGMGLKALNESRRREASYKNRAAEYSQRAKMRRLRDVHRSDARAGSLGDNTEDRIASYIRYGGRPENYGQFLLEQHMIGTTDRAQLDFLEAVKDPTRQADALRLLHVLSPLTDEDF